MLESIPLPNLNNKVASAYKPVAEQDVISSSNQRSSDLNVNFGIFAGNNGAHLLKATQSNV